jgi:hypothetical protein
MEGVKYQINMRSHLPLSFSPLPPSSFRPRDQVYFELIPTSWQFKYTRKHLGNYNIYDQFAIDAANGDLANYSEWGRLLVSMGCLSEAARVGNNFSLALVLYWFARLFAYVAVWLCGLCGCVAVSRCPAFIDPSYYEFLGKAARDQHPDHDVAEGEQLIKEVRVRRLFRRGSRSGTAALVCVMTSEPAAALPQPGTYTPPPTSPTLLSGAHYALVKLRR